MTEIEPTTKSKSTTRGRRKLRLGEKIREHEAERRHSENEAARKHRGQRGGDDDADADAFSVREFARRHGLSVAMIYKLWKLDRGPKKLRIGARVLITRESAAQWRREREAAQD